MPSWSSSPAGVKIQVHPLGHCLCSCLRAALAHRVLHVRSQAWLPLPHKRLPSESRSLFLPRFRPAPQYHCKSGSGASSSTLSCASFHPLEGSRLIAASPPSDSFQLPKESESFPREWVKRRIVSVRRSSFPYSRLSASDA